MTFNVYLLLAIVIGAGVGHFFFIPRRTNTSIGDESCH